MRKPARRILDPRRILEEIETRVDAEWQKALPFYQSRKAALFMSYCRFWEAHSQPHQSLARVLGKHGIPCVWYDGMGQWGGNPSELPSDTPNVELSEMITLRGRRFPPIGWMNDVVQSYLLRRKITKAGHPMVWVHGGITEGLAKRLPYVDVFSYFDDVYRHRPSDPLFQRAQLVLTQNDYGTRLLQPFSKVRTLLPPLEVHPNVFSSTSLVTMPAGFPERRMGYIGSCFGGYFDFDLLEKFVTELKDWGFVIVGRTDREGEMRIRELSRHSNFIYFPFMRRSQLASFWSAISVTLLLYRPQQNQMGSFATKVLESVYFGVPVVGVEAPKTERLAQFFPLCSDPDNLLQAAIDVATHNDGRCEEAYRHFGYEMHPKHHLAQVAAWLTGKRNLR